MNKKIVYILFALALLVSCKPSSKTEISEILASKDSEKAQISSIGVPLSSTSKNKTKEWLAYKLLQSKMDGYYKTTKSEALQNAMELANLIRSASDTIKVEKLDRKDIKIRFNVLRNVALRLDDMSTIPSITYDEVMQEVTNLLEAFSSLNEKINTIYKIEEYEKLLDITTPEPPSLEESLKPILKNKKPTKKIPKKPIKNTKRIKKLIAPKSIDLRKH